MGGLLVSNTWVYGDVMDLAVFPDNGQMRVRLYCEPGKPHVLLGSRDFANWIPLVTNTPAASFFDFVDPAWPREPKRFYRAVKADQVVTNLSLSINSATRHALLTATVRPNKFYSLDASTDLLHWTPLTNANPATSVFQLLDTNAPAFPRRFYRVWGVGK